MRVSGIKCVVLFAQKFIPLYIDDWLNKKQIAKRYEAISELADPLLAIVCTSYFCEDPPVAANVCALCAYVLVLVLVLVCVCMCARACVCVCACVRVINFAFVCQHIVVVSTLRSRLCARD